MAYVVVHKAKRESLRKELTGPLVIGRATECDLSIPDARLSRLHCRIEEESPNHWVLLDLSSKNGTTVHDQKIDRHDLSDGDTFEIGDHRITFHLGPFVPKRPKNPLDESHFASPPDPHSSAITESSSSATESPESASESEPQPAIPSPIRRATNVVIRKPAGSKSAMKQSSDSTTLAAKPLAFQRPPAAPQVDATIDLAREEPTPRNRRISRLWIWIALILGISALATLYWFAFVR
jgi:predicted component of type VI protein secretion system